jgi:lipopolysaccharide export LptBFGC system permease protein LptF
LRSIGGVLDRYFLRRFASLYAGTLLSFSLTYVVLDLFEHLDEWSRESSGFLDLVVLVTSYYGLVLPVVFCQILGPIVCLTAGLFTLTLFQRANELVPLLANGRSHARAVAPLLAASLLIAVLTFLVQELWIPRTRATLREVSGKREGSEVVLDQKHRDPDGVLISVRRYHLLQRRGEGVTVLAVGGGRDHEFIVHAQSMEWVEPELGVGGGYWLLRSGTEQEYRAGEAGRPARLVAFAQPETPGAPERLLKSFVERQLDTTLRPEDFEVRGEQIVYMSLGEMRAKLAGSLDRSWSVKYYSRFAHPLNNFVLLLLGLPVTLYFGTRNVFFGALLAASVSTVYFVVTSACADLAVRGLVSGPVAVGLGPLFFSALGATWLRYLRT